VVLSLNACTTKTAGALAILFPLKTWKLSKNLTMIAFVAPVWQYLPKIKADLLLLALIF
jgi:hypothetical protein